MCYPLGSLRTMQGMKQLHLLVFDETVCFSGVFTAYLIFMLCILMLYSLLIISVSTSFFFIFHQFCRRLLVFNDESCPGLLLILGRTEHIVLDIIVCKSSESYGSSNYLKLQLNSIIHRLVLSLSRHWFNIVIIPHVAVGYTIVVICLVSLSL